MEIPNDEAPPSRRDDDFADGGEMGGALLSCNATVPEMSAGAPPRSGSDGLSHSEDDFRRFNHQLRLLTQAAQLVTSDRELGALLRIVRSTARNLLDADGVTVVLREGDFCHYAEEDAIAPLWKGKRFPMDDCISGWVMKHNTPAYIEDISLDPRIPFELYRPTFVKSLAMFPMSIGEPLGAIGCYWARAHATTRQEQQLMALLADLTARSIDSIRAYSELEQRLHAQERAEAALRESRLLLGQLSRQLLAAQELERRRIARELHDQLGQSLALLQINLQSVGEMPEATEVAGALGECIDMVEALHEQVRNLSLDLHPSVLDDLGLVPALRWHVDRLAQSSGLAIRFAGGESIGRHSPEVETTCFRVAQEALTNVLRHSQGQQASVDISQDGSTLVLRIADDGVGFDQEAALQGAAEGRSMGLLSMEERIKLVGGALRIESAPNRGTVVRATFPIKGSDPPLGGALAAADSGF